MNEPALVNVYLLAPCKVSAQSIQELTLIVKQSINGASVEKILTTVRLPCLFRKKFKYFRKIIHFLILMEFEI